LTRKTNARVAGFTFLAYIALGLTAVTLFGRATSGDSTAAKLARIAGHATDMRIAILLELLTCFAAIALGVTLYALTRDEDHDIAMLGMVSRVCESFATAVFLQTKLELLWLGTSVGASAPDGASAKALGDLLFSGTSTWNVTIGATFFAVGSTCFAWLLLRGRLIPVVLAWIGVIASVLLVIGLPLQLAGVIHSPVTTMMWLPMVVFEVPVGFWMMIKGVSAPRSPA
jgi:hypothetical protein